MVRGWQERSWASAVDIENLVICGRLVFLFANGDFFVFRVISFFFPLVFYDRG